MATTKRGKGHRKAVPIRANRHKDYRTNPKMRVWIEPWLLEGFRRDRFDYGNELDPNYPMQPVSLNCTLQIAPYTFS